MSLWALFVEDNAILAQWGPGDEVDPETEVGKVLCLCLKGSADYNVNMETAAQVASFTHKAVVKLEAETPKGPWIIVSRWLPGS